MSTFDGEAFIKFLDGRTFPLYLDGSDMICTIKNKVEDLKPEPKVKVYFAGGSIVEIDLGKRNSGKVDAKKVLRKVRDACKMLVPTDLTVKDVSKKLVEWGFDAYTAIFEEAKIGGVELAKMDLPWMDDLDVKKIHRRSFLSKIEELFKSQEVQSVNIEDKYGNQREIKLSDDDAISLRTISGFCAPMPSPHTQRIIFAGKQLEDARTLQDYGICCHKPMFYLVTRLVGDIGHFGTHQLELFSHFLRKEKLDRPSTQAIAEIIASEDGDPHSTFEFCSSPLLSESNCANLRRYIDKLHSVDPKEDLKVKMRGKQLESIIGRENLIKCLRAFGARCDEVKLRRSEALGKHINFHTDCAEKTMQVALIDDECNDGGRLLFVNSKGFHVPLRKCGSYTVHNNSIVHGVTQLNRGVRYGLFFLQQLPSKPN